MDIGASSSPLNQTPVVSVGSSNTLSVTFPANNIPLNGTVTDSGPFTPTILWSWTSGPAAPVFANPASAATTGELPCRGRLRPHADRGMSGARGERDPHRDGARSPHGASGRSDDRGPVRRREQSAGLCGASDRAAPWPDGHRNLEHGLGTGDGDVWDTDGQRPLRNDGDTHDDGDVQRVGELRPCSDRDRRHVRELRLDPRDDQRRRGAGCQREREPDAPAADDDERGRSRSRLSTQPAALVHVERGEWPCRGDVQRRESADHERDAPVPGCVRHSALRERHGADDHRVADDHGERNGAAAAARTHGAGTVDARDRRYRRRRRRDATSRRSRGRSRTPYGRSSTASAAETT